MPRSTLSLLTLLANGHRGLFLREWLGREVDHTLPTTAEVKNTRIYTYIPPYAFMA
jgi:hypothetical protein